MSGTFTDDDIEKTVENANGEVIGTIAAVEGDTARVEPRAGIMDSIKATLGWNRGREKTVTIHEDAVSDISSETIRLEAESVEPLEAGREAEVEPTESTDVDSAGDRTEPRRDSKIDDREPDTGSDERERAGDFEETAAEPTDAGSNSHPAANRDPGSELAEEMSEVAKRDATGVTDEPLDSHREDEPLDSHREDEPLDSHREDEPLDSERKRETPAERDEGVEGTAASDASGELETEAIDGEGSVEPTDGDTSPEEAAEIDAQSARGESDETRPTAPADSMEEQELPDDGSAESQDLSEDSSAEREPSRDSSAGTTDETDLADELDRGVDIESAVDTAESGGADTEERTATDDDDIADEIDLGVDIESAADPGDTAGDSSETEPTNLADELDRGVDIESAADPGDTAGDSSETEPTNLADELDRGVDIEAVAKTDAGSNSETDSRSETGSDADSDGETTTAGDERSADEIDPGIDLESAVESDRRSEPVVDPDTVAGGRSAAETGAQAAAREIVPEGAAVTERTERATGEPAADRPSLESDPTDRTRERPRSSSPLAAMVGVQRAAMIQGQEMLRQSLAAQQRAARGAVEAPLLVQRQSLEAARTAIRRYFDAVDAVTGTGPSREQRTSTDEAVTELEGAHSRLEDEELEEFLSGHLEQIRALQTRIDDLDGAEPAQVARLLERQLALLEECQRRLDG